MGDRVAIRETILRRRRRPRALRAVINGLHEVIPDASRTTRAAVARDLTHRARLERRRPPKHTRRDRKDGRVLEALVATMGSTSPTSMCDRQIQTIGVLRKVVAQDAETMRRELARNPPRGR